MQKTRFNFFGGNPSTPEKLVHNENFQLNSEEMHAYSPPRNSKSDYLTKRKLAEINVEPADTFDHKVQIVNETSDMNLTTKFEKTLSLNDETQKIHTLPQVIEEYNPSSETDSYMEISETQNQLITNTNTDIPIDLISLQEEQEFSTSSFHSLKAIANCWEPKEFRRLQKKDLITKFRKQCSVGERNTTPSSNPKFVSQMGALGLEMINVECDENNQFRVFARQIYGTQDAYSVIRYKVMNEILTNPLDYLEFFAGTDTNQNTNPIKELQKYVLSMECDGERGDILTMYAFANFIGADIYIFTPLLPIPLLICSSRTPQVRGVILMGYPDGCYYHSLVSKRDPEVEKKLKASSKIQNISKFGIPSLIDLCIYNIVQDIPEQSNFPLPEELLQRTIDIMNTDRLQVDSTTQHELFITQLFNPFVEQLDFSNYKHLTKASFVKISQCKSLKQLNLMNCSISSESAKMISNCTELEIINLSGCHKIDSSAFQSILKNCSKLKSIDFSDCKLTDEVLQYAFKYCLNLTSLEVQNCYNLSNTGFQNIKNTIKNLNVIGCIKLNDKFLDYVSKNCSNLISLSLGNLKISDTGLTKVLQQNSGLKKISLQDCQDITDISIQTISQWNPQIEHLNLTGCNIKDCAFETASGFPMVSSYEGDCRYSSCFNKLNYLNLSRCFNITDKTLSLISSRSPYLEFLYLASCEKITDKGIISFLNSSFEENEKNFKLEKEKHNYKLKEVDFSNIPAVTDEAISAIAQQSTANLNSLVLSKCSKITDHSLESLNLCPSLKVLDLSQCNITDSGLNSSLQFAPNLEVLSLQDCGLSDLAVIEEISNLKYLKKLNIAYNSLITDKALVSIAKGCPDITHFDISYCGLITTKGLRKASSFLNVLTSLRIRGSSLSKDFFLDQPHTNLTELDLSWSRNLEDGAISSISKLCPELQSLEIAHCTKVSGNSVLKLTRRCQKLKRINVTASKNVSLLMMKYLSANGIKIKR